MTIKIEIPVRKLEIELDLLRPLAAGNSFAAGAAFTLIWLLRAKQQAPSEVLRPAGS